MVSESVFGIRYSVFGVQCSVFGIRCSVENVVESRQCLVSTISNIMKSVISHLSILHSTCRKSLTDYSSLSSSLVTNQSVLLLPFPEKRGEIKQQFHIGIEKYLDC